MEQDINQKLMDMNMKLLEVIKESNNKFANVIKILTVSITIPLTIVMAFFIYAYFYSDYEITTTNTTTQNSNNDVEGNMTNTMEVNR